MQVSTTWQSVDGLRSRQESLGVAGASTSVQSRPMLGAASGTQTNPDGTGIVTGTSILPNGNQQILSRKLDSENLTLETSTSISDAFGRTIESTNGRGHVTQYTYHDAGGQIKTMTQVNAAPPPTPGNLETHYSYILTLGTGRRTVTTLPDGTFQYQETNILGQTTRQWGSQINPVSFTYDAAGRQASLTTYRAPVGANADTFPSITGDTTTWTYDPSGVLLQKTYADGKGTSYTYDIAGRMFTRTWARGVVTTYGYTAGQIASIDYSDTTPDVIRTYNRLGQPVTIANAYSAKTNVYDANLGLDIETVTIDPDGPGPQPSMTRILDRSNDALGRDTGFQLKTESLNTEHSAAYGYNDSGRMSAVTSPAGTFSYTYSAGSSLLATVTGPVHTVTNTWELNRDVLTTKENKIVSTNTVVSSFTYAVNPLNQRTSVQTSGSAFNSAPANWAWGYDPLGQVVSADSPTSGFDRAYQYDAIGNRTSSTDNTALTTYAANELNQYSQISPPSPSSSVGPLQDDDGNQIEGEIHPEGAPAKASIFVWDAENRLVAVKDKATEAVIVSYVYDAGSRRVARMQTDNTKVYLYDGWNCLAEYSLQNSSFILQTSLTWGLDLSGSLQGAGGVGGLLATTNHQESGSSNIFFPTCDGNGNVSEYITTSGTIAAHYEYEPFGRIIVANGSEVANFTYRFSMKTVDLDTGLCYYGRRFYVPETGRWNNRDPIEEEGGVNLYSFVANSTLRKSDKLGMSVWIVEGDNKITPEMLAYYNQLVDNVKQQKKMVLEILAKKRKEPEGVKETEFFWIDNKGVSQSPGIGEQAAVEFEKRVNRETLEIVAAPFKTEAGDTEVLAKVWDGHKYDYDITVYYTHGTVEEVSKIAYPAEQVEADKVTANLMKNFKAKGAKGEFIHSHCDLNFFRYAKYTWPAFEVKDRDALYYKTDLGKKCQIKFFSYDVEIVSQPIPKLPKE